MKKLSRLTIALMLAMTMIFGTCLSAYAAEITEPSSTESASVHSADPMVNQIRVTKSYTTICSGSSISSHSLYMRLYNNSNMTHLDVRMKDINGNVLWEEYCAIDYASSRTFSLGSNVYKVEARLAAKDMYNDLFGEKTALVNWNLNSGS